MDEKPSQPWQRRTSVDEVRFQNQLQQEALAALAATTTALLSGPSRKIGFDSNSICYLG